MDVVLELAHIARPGGAAHARDRIRRELPARPAGLVHLLEEVVRDQLDILAALAQRGHLEREDVQAMIEVIAQLALAHGLARIAVGGRDDAHVGLDRAAGADAHQRPGLEHAQQAHLELERHLRDLVEEERAAVGLLEVALVLAIGAGVAAALVAEHLVLDQVRRDRAAVDGEERVLAPAAQLVDRARDDLLAGAALAQEQHGRFRRGDARDLVVYVLHRGRAPDEAAEAPEAAQLVAQRADLRAQLAAARHARQHRLQALQVDRLGEVIGGAQAQRLDRALDARMPGDEDGLDRRAILEIVQQVHAIAVGQAQVHEDHVGPLPHELHASLGDRACGGGGETFIGGEGSQCLARVDVVVDDQYMRHGIGCSGW